MIITSREDGRERSVRGWYVLAEGAIYLFTYSYALRVARWRRDPWIRLRVPGGGPSLEGSVRFVGANELRPDLTDQIIERWWMWGATTAEGLRRMLQDGSHVLLRVDAPSAA